MQVQKAIFVALSCVFLGQGTPMLSLSMHHSYSRPILSRPRVITQGGTNAFKKLINTATLMQYSPYFETYIDPNQPLRKSMIAPKDNGSFCKPIKQSFIRNPRLSPMTRVLLTLLSGWAGSGGPITTTTGILGKHVSRCRRTVYNLLKDAVDEGYLTYVRTKCRMGKYTGIKIYLNFAAIRFTGFTTKAKTPENSHSTREKFTTETNTKQLLSINNTHDDAELWDKLAQLAASAGYLDDKSPPI